MSGSTCSKPCQSRKKSSKLPKGWMDCPAASLIICNTFVAFKTPLSYKYRNCIPNGKEFNINTLFSSMEMQGVSIGLLINLTNTKRYYDASEVQNIRCKYVNIPCEGFKSPPNYNQTQQFLNICYEFAANNPSQYIGVHCTHGHNRTGFMIVSYLVEILGFDVYSAIAQFAAARPPGIYKQNKIDELFRRYSNRRPIRASEHPHWSSH